MMMNYKEAKRVFLNNEYREGAIVLKAWELPDSFIFEFVMDGGGARYDRVYRDEDHPLFEFSPEPMLAYLDEGKQELDALLANARRIL